jgi:hypothetical protein
VRFAAQCSAFVARRVGTKFRNASGTFGVVRDDGYLDFISKIKLPSGAVGPAMGESLVGGKHTAILCVQID